MDALSWYTILDIAAKITFGVVWSSFLAAFVIFVGHAVIKTLTKGKDDNDGADE